jgi:biotin-(acetyl-CoA carboxylase) ligase
LCGILAEGRTIERGMRVVLGIGVNLKTSQHNSDFDVAFLDEVANIDFEDFDRRLHCELASLLEERDDIPPIRYEEIRVKTLEEMKKMGLPKFNDIVYESFDLNERGEMIISGVIIDDGEDITWV